MDFKRFNTEWVIGFIFLMALSLFAIPAYYLTRGVDPGDVASNQETSDANMSVDEKGDRVDTETLDYSLPDESMKQDQAKDMVADIVATFLPSFRWGEQISPMAYRITGGDKQEAENLYFLMNMYANDNSLEPSEWTNKYIFDNIVEITFEDNDEVIVSSKDGNMKNMMELKYDSEIKGWELSYVNPLRAAISQG